MRNALAVSPNIVDTAARELDISEHCYISVPPSESLSDIHSVKFSIIAGSIAGMLSCLIFHPFDVIRTKMQASTLPTTSLRNTSHQLPRSNGRPMCIVRDTVHLGGIRALYAGLSLPLAAQACYKATIFTVNTMTKNMLIDLKASERRKMGICSNYSLSFVDYFICGATSGAINALAFVCPVEYVRNQLIVQKADFTGGPIDVIRHTYKVTGLRGLWRGAGITLARDSIGCGTYFLMYEIGLEYIPVLSGRKRGDFWNSLQAGFLAGFGYWAASLPLDSLKTLVQTGTASSSREAVNFLTTRYGLLGAIKQLYIGWQFGFGRGSPSAALTLTAYASIFEYCTNENRNNK